MNGINFYILDTETTGLSTKLHDVIEISIIRCSDKNQMTKNIKADNPKNASLEALKVNGKSISDLYNRIR